MTLRKKPGHHISLHGHRGSRGTHPENTMPAYGEGFESGADYVELDVHLTADGEVIVYHDPDISSRLCCYRNGKAIDQRLPIHQLKASELSQFDCGSVPQRDFPKQLRIPGEHIPLLSEVLQWASQKASGLGVNIEMKLGKDSTRWQPEPVDFMKRVLGLIQKYAMLDRVLVQSFDFRPLRAARELEPKLLLSFLFDAGTDFVAGAIKEKAPIVAPYFEMITKESVQKCHQKGILVLPWTVNEPRDWKRLLEYGVDGIITDYPREFVRLSKTL